MARKLLPVPATAPAWSEGKRSRMSAFQVPRPRREPRASQESRDFYQKLCVPVNAGIAVGLPWDRLAEDHLAI
jgi:hypothetical protein